MNVETVALFTSIPLIIFIFAETAKDRRVIGIVASMLLILLGLWIYFDGIQIQSGEVKAVNLNEFHNITAPNYDNVTITGNETTTATYTSITTSLIDFNTLLATVLILCAIFGVMYYALSA